MEFLKSTERIQNVLVESNTVYSYPTHMHTYFELMLYLPFDGSISINDHDFSVCTPTCILIAPSDFHRTTVNGERRGRFVKVGFEESILPPESLPRFSAVLQDLGQDDFLLRIFEELVNSEHNKLYRTMLVNAAVCILDERGTKLMPVHVRSNLRLAASAVKIINEQFGEGISERDVARRLSVSPQYLSRVFKETVGIGFSAHLASVRIRRAAKMLLETDAGVTEICYACGFGNLSHFLRTFKSEYGISPAAYRKQNTAR